MRRALALVLSTIFVVAVFARGTSWTDTPVDPSIEPGEYALIAVTHGASNAVAAAAEAVGASHVASLSAIDVVTARVSASALGHLAHDPRVVAIASDADVVAAGRGQQFEKVKGAASPGISVVNAQAAWRTATGKGVTVAVMDTGIADHPDLTGSVIARVNFVDDDETEADPSGHGTFVAGLIAAHGATFRGVAPDAKLVSLRVLDLNGHGTMRSVLAAFDWLLKHRIEYGIRVLSLSFGAPQKASYHRTLLAGVVESAHFAGITVLSAAGNGGPLPGSVVMPGADPFVVTVGSLADQGTLATSDDRESVFSGRGPTRDGFTKPDVLAPGEHVVSLRAAGSAMDRSSHDGSSGSAYARLSGTSASTAIAAGVAALVLQAHPAYRPTAVKGALVAGTRHVPGTKTRALLADAALTVQPARVNVGIWPSYVLVYMLAKSGLVLTSGISWEGISWEGISWETISWEGVAWESVSWEGIDWELLTLEPRS